jgi:hypothetical protein
MLQACHRASFREIEFWRLMFLLLCKPALLLLQDAAVTLATGRIMHSYDNYKVERTPIDGIDEDKSQRYTGY